MKKYVTPLLTLILIMAVIPTAAHVNLLGTLLSHTNSTEAVNNSIVAASKDSRYNIPENLTFTDTGTGKETSRSAKAIIHSIVGAVVDKVFTENEVKALAVAIHTQLCHENDSHALMIDTKNSHIFLNESNLKDKFGENYTTLCSHCDNVYSELILISDKPADMNIEYLKNNPDPGDNVIYKAAPFNTLSGDYSVTVSVDKDNFFDTLKKLNPDINTDTSPQKAVGEITYLNSGEVDAVNICGVRFSGSEIAAAFSLPYRRFTLIYSLNKFMFTSLRCDISDCITPAAAKFMSRQGNTYTEILGYCCTSVNFY